MTKMVIDAHQHFWSLSRGDYAWPNETVAPIFKDFLPEDLRPLLKQAAIYKTVLVQATDTVAETEYLLRVAHETDFVAGVVGWVDLSADEARQTIEALASNKSLVGLRPMLQDIADTDWILRPDVQDALKHMEDAGLCLDALIQPRHLFAIAEIAHRFPRLKIIIDHMAKPVMGHGQRPGFNWVDGIEALGRCNNVTCKLSGLVTEIGPGWQPADLRPFVDVVMRSFGPQWIMFGSDWPVVNLASDYLDWFSFVTNYLEPFEVADRDAVMGGTAQLVYGLD